MVVYGILFGGMRPAELHIKAMSIKCPRGPRAIKIELIRNEGNVLFNDALSTFYLRLYDGGYML